MYLESLASIQLVSIVGSADKAFSLRLRLRASALNHLCAAGPRVSGRSVKFSRVHLLGDFMNVLDIGSFLRIRVYTDTHQISQLQITGWTVIAKTDNWKVPRRTITCA